MSVSFSSSNSNKNKEEKIRIMKGEYTFIESKLIELLDGFIKIEAIKENKQITLIFQRGKGKWILDIYTVKLNIEQAEELKDILIEILKIMKDKRMR